MNWDRPWDLNDIAQHYGLTRRVVDDLSRDKDCPHFPKPFGSVGRSRLWDPLAARAAKEAILEYVAGSARRSISQREAELQREKAALERKKAAFEAEMQRLREGWELFRAAERDNAIEMDGGNSGRGSGFGPMAGGGSR